jgi:hypothetical protein
MPTSAQTGGLHHDKNDKLADMYWYQINDMTDNEYVEDTKKISQNSKVWAALLEIIKDTPDLQDYAEQLDKAMMAFSNACEIRAFKIGISTGQAIISAKA